MHDYKEKLNLALKYISENKRDTAIEILKEIISKDSKNFLSFFYLGNIFLEKKNYELAKIYLEKAISVNPSISQVYNSLGLAYSNLRNFNEAEKLLNKAIEINNNIPEPYNNLGLLKRDKNDIFSAENFFNKAIQKNKRYFPAYNNLMELYERTNQNDLLEKIINKSNEIFLNNKINKLYEGKLYYKKKNFLEAIKILEPLKFNNLEITFEKARLLNLAKSFDKIGSYDQAFIYFKSLNDFTILNSPKYLNKDSYNSRIDSRKSFLNSLEKIPWKEIETNPCEDPVFMIGFPRSGTTLLDSILRSHPNVEVIEEKPIVENLISEINKITTVNFSELNKLNVNDLKNLQNFYFEERKKYLDLNKSYKIIIDKLPLNIIYVPEILRVFPNSKFIFSLRHPFDCVLSCYFQNFKLNSPMSNFLKLDDAANFYDSVMEIWVKSNKIFNPNICELKYEDLIFSFKNSINKVLDFLKIEWHEELFSFNEIAKKRKISTPSYYQVTEPINNKAIGRWKNYNSEINKIKPIINKWVDFYKY